MKEKKRNLIQAAAALIQNSHLSGFFTGRLYQGNGKALCVPGLNCYSCPGAVGACPIGSLQAVLGGRGHKLPYYVLGVILLFGISVGRLICGFLCPFGFIQDLLYKIRTPKLHIPDRIDKPLRWGKYLSLAAVVILPIILTDAFGLGTPVFCKYLCPAGTLEGGIPLLIHNETLREAIGFLFTWKAAVLAVIIIASVFIYRPFCKYLCPLGAMYGLFNRLSLYRMHVDSGKCTDCGACKSVCKMGVDVTKNINSAECIRCGKCKSVCSANAIQSGLLNNLKTDYKNREV